MKTEKIFSLIIGLTNLHVNSSEPNLSICEFNGFCIFKLRLDSDPTEARGDGSVANCN